VLVLLGSFCKPQRSFLFLIEEKGRGLSWGVFFDVRKKEGAFTMEIKRNAVAGLFFLGCLAMVSCDQDDEGDNGTSTTTTPMTTSTSTMMQSTDMEKLVSGLHVFGVELYQQLKDTGYKDSTFVISPYSVSNCMAMAYAGARTNTEKQMADVLHYTLPQANVPTTFQTLNTSLISGNSMESTAQYELKLSMRNSGWLQQDYPFLPAYIDMLAAGFSAEVTLLDFEEYIEARARINQWADNQTEGKIAELIPEGVLGKDTKLVLVNAIYYKGSWQEPFDEGMTREQAFYLLDGSAVNVSMMSGSGHFMYAEDAEMQAVALPYVTPGSLAMAIILPKQGLFEQAEQALSGERFHAIIGQMRARQASLTIPKFSCRSNRDLVADLTAMGMTDVFDWTAADLSGMDGQAGALYVPFVIHEAVIAIDEKGTEAAAATAAIVAPTASPDEQDAVDFAADHPFIYAIYDQQTGAVLFLGRVLKPEQEE